MPKTSSEIIIQFAGGLEKDIIKAIPLATGETRKSVRTKFAKTFGIISGFETRGGSQIGAIIDGRKPTKPGAKSSGGQTLQEQLFDWIKALRIQPREATMTQLSLSWAMATHIHEHGYKGKGDIFAKVFTKNRFASLTKTLVKAETLSLASSLIKELKI